MPNENLLRFEASPYLRQHADNPVHWIGWGPEALNEARARGVPILLSVGYAACHWCHVMAHESFEDEAVAAVMNALFVCVKVDREERPEIDEIYMSALAMMGEQGGWPLTMFLDHTGRPFWGGTYFPKEPAYGRPGFVQLMQEISRAYNANDPQIEKNMRAITDGLKARASVDSAGDYPADIAQRAMRSLSAHIDETHGGLGGAPQFPQPILYLFLLEQALLSHDQIAQKRILHCLRQICRGGIFDHLGGGFARYTVDAAWLIPHFEKMLYDNALLLPWLCMAYRATGEALFARRVSETIDWLTRELTLENGAFAASLDADSEGEEGKFYIWSWEELGEALGEARTDFAAAYGCSEDGNFEGKNILNRLHQSTDLDDDYIAERRALYERRCERIAPTRDDKMLADWNGMMIAGLAEAAVTFDRDDWLAQAETAFLAVRETLGTEDGLYHSYCDGTLLEVRLGEDLAYMALAATALFSATGQHSYLDHAHLWISTLERDHGVRDGFCSALANQQDIIVRNRPIFDSAVPSLNGTMLWVYASVAHITGDLAIYDKAKTLCQTFSGHLTKSYIQMPQFMRGAHRLEHGVTIVIVTPEFSHPLYRDMRRIIAQKNWPNLILIPLLSEDVNSFSPLHPAHGKQLINNAPTAYLCTQGSCQAPATSIEALNTTLAGLNLS